MTNETQTTVRETCWAVLQVFLNVMILAPATLVISGGGWALAQQRTMAIYEDWTVSCAVTPGSGAKTCGLIQVQKIEGQATAVSQIGIGRAADTGPLRVSLEIGANAWIPTGIKLIAGDSSAAITATFKWCNSTRCLADADLSDADITKLRAQKGAGQILYKAASQTDVSIPVSFAGFSEALDGLPK